MHNEFLELTGLTETYISFSEYTTFIEPIYMDCKISTKQEFCNLLKESFEKIVYPVVEKKIHNLSINEKLDIIDCNSFTIREEIEKVDFEARKIAYQYIKLMADL